MSAAEKSTKPSLWLRLAGVAWPGHPARWRDVPGRLQGSMVGVVRLTLAAVISYLLTLVLTEGAIDLTGPLTALLVVQASAYSTLKMGIVRVGAVLSGVLVATALSTVVGLTWWSLGAAIAASLILAKVLRLGEQALEVPISAMLILGVTNQDVASEIRIANTLIGAGVGVAFNLLYPPAMPARRAGQSLIRVANAAADPLDAASDGLVAGPVTRQQVDAWLDDVRAGAREVANAGQTIASLKDSRRFNPRALGTTDIEPVLASGLETLEHCLMAVRALFMVLREEIPPEEEPDDPYGEELRQAFAVVLHDAGDSLRAFGSLVVAEAEGHEEETEQALAENLEMLRETQAILTELILVNAQNNTSSWLLRGSILAALEQVLVRLNLEDRARIRQSWREEEQRRPALPLLIRGMLPHPERPYPRGLQPAMEWRWPARMPNADQNPRPAPDDTTDS